MLNSKQRAYLKGLSMNIEPIIQIGKNGIDDNLIETAFKALDARELIKINVLQNCDLEVLEVGKQLEEKIHGAQLVCTIGKKIILFKKSTKAKNRKINI